MKKITINIMRLLILPLILMATLRLTPVAAAQSGIREQIESIQDAGILTAYDAGLVRELGLTASLEPLQAEESVPELNMTIEWFYADRMRMAFGYRLSGIPYTEEACQLTGGFLVSDSKGEQLSSAASAEITGWDRESGDIFGILLIYQHFNLQAVSLEKGIMIDATLGEQNEKMSGLGYVGNLTQAYCNLSPQIIQTESLSTGEQSQPGKFHFEIDGITSDQVFIDNEEESLTVNGIRFRKLWAEITPSTTQIVLAFQKPTAEYWNPRSIFSSYPLLEVNGSRASMVSSAHLYDADFPEYKISAAEDIRRAKMLPDRNPGESYQRLTFNVGTVDPIQPLTLTIQNIEPWLPEQMPADMAARKITGPWTFEIIPGQSARE